MPTVREFSKRHGFRPRPAEQTREGTPDALRAFTLRHLSKIARGDIHRARDLASGSLQYIPNPANRSVDEIWTEIQHAMATCAWFFIYDLIEEIYRHQQWSHDEAEAFRAEVNELFFDHNLGWQLQAVQIPITNLYAPEIVIRGDAAFELAVTSAADALASSGFENAKKELAEAIHDLSRRPDPDLTGAVHHAIAALECVAAELCKEPGETLGQIIKRHPDRFPSPLGDAISKLYGFASDRGRHVTEGKGPSQKEAEFIVSIAAAMSALLLR